MVRKMKLMLAALVIGGATNVIHAVKSIKFIGQSDIGTSGYTITTTGLYVLTEDVSFASSGTAIIIASDNVILDLNNKHVLGNAFATGICVSGNHKNINVKNGVISEFGVTGFDGETGGISVEQLSLQNLKFAHQDTSPSGTGILIKGSNIEIDNCLTCSFNIGTQLDSCNEVIINKLISNFNTYSSSTAMGLYLNGCNDVGIKNSTFNCNSGAGVYGLQVFSCSNVYVQDSHCDSNKATAGNDCSGAWIDGGRIVDFSRCTFNANSGGSHVVLGVGVVNNLSYVSLTDCDACNNNSGTGTPLLINGIQVNIPSTLSCKNCRFNSNTGSASTNVIGALIATAGVTGIFDSCEANYNSSELGFGHGFGISSAATSTILFKDCLAKNNSGATLGIGFRIESGATNCIIQNCQAINNSSNGFRDLNATAQNWYAGNIAFGQGANNYSSIISSVTLGRNAQPGSMSFDERSIDNLSIN